MRISSPPSKPLSPRHEIRFSLIFSMIFIVVGVSVAGFGIRDLIRAKASVSWPTTQGTVMSSSVEYHKSNNGRGTYHAEVMYDFNIHGKTFSGNRIAYGDYGSSNPSRARRVVNRYPKGKVVTVYYMPAT